MHLIGFIIRIYHDARSPERQIHICDCKRDFITDDIIVTLRQLLHFSAWKNIPHSLMQIFVFFAPFCVTRDCDWRWSYEFGTS